VVTTIEEVKLNSCYNFDADFIFFPQLDMNFIKVEPDSDFETCLSYCQSENELIGRSDEQDPLFISHPVIKTENEASFFVYMYILMFVVAQASLTFTCFCCCVNIFQDKCEKACKYEPNSIKPDCYYYLRVLLWPDFINLELVIKYMKVLDARFEVFTAVSMKISVFWVVALCSLVDVNLRPDCTAQQPRRRKSSKL
jgi:hypothetical protein